MSGGGDEAPWLELAIGGVGALLVVSMTGYLLHDAFRTGERRPVDIVLERGEIAARGVGWHVPVLVRNTGDRPVEAVELRATLKPASGDVEEAALTVDFLPPRGSVDATFLFERDPSVGELRLRAVGFREP